MIDLLTGKMALTMSGAAYCDVIRSVVRTEKATAAYVFDKVYFEVSASATKSLVKSAVESLFSAKVVAVNSLNRYGKTLRFKGVTGRRKNRKVAVVTLEKGHNIDFIEQ